MEVFWDKGYEHASMSDLTAAMGLKPPSVYAAFGDKEALFREAVSLYTATQGREIWDQLEAAATAREAIHNWLLATADAYAGEAASRGCMIVLAAPQKAGASPAVCNELKQRRRRNVSLLKRRLQRAVTEGELPADLDCTALANFFATVQHGMSIQARDGASRGTLRTIANCAVAGWEPLLAAH